MLCAYVWEAGLFVIYFPSRLYFLAELCIHLLVDKTGSAAEYTCEERFPNPDFFIDELNQLQGRESVERSQDHSMSDKEMLGHSKTT